LNVRALLDALALERIEGLCLQHMPMRRIACVVGRRVATIRRAVRTLGLSSLKVLEPRVKVVRYEHERPSGF